MKKIAVFLLLSAVISTLAFAITVVSPTIRTSVIGLGPIPTSTTRMAPFATPAVSRFGNVAASVDRSTGRVWMASAGDITSPSPDVAEVIFRGNDTRATGTDKYSATVSVDLPEEGYARKGSGEIMVYLAIFDAAGNFVPLEGGGNERSFGNPISFAGSGTLRTFSVTTNAVLPAGNIYYVKAGFKIRSNQGGIHALGGGLGSDISKGVKVKSISLSPFYFG